jgi:hypothetical protein
MADYPPILIRYLGVLAILDRLAAAYMNMLADNSLYDTI